MINDFKIGNLDKHCNSIYIHT